MMRGVREERKDAMIPLTQLQELAKMRQEEILREAANDRLIRNARKARYARFGSGFRFIAAGELFFRCGDDRLHAA
jgi:hypothetical protein